MAICYRRFVRPACLLLLLLLSIEVISVVKNSVRARPGYIDRSAEASPPVYIKKVIVATTAALAIFSCSAAPASATPNDQVDLGGAEISLTGQPNAWERQRQKRTTAIKLMEKKGMIKVATDDNGTQYLKLPWIPNRDIPYKSLSVSQRLFNEVCAGAFGEIFKDGLLHALDTLKTRRQSVQSKKGGDENDSRDNNNNNNNNNNDNNNNGESMLITTHSSNEASSLEGDSASTLTSAAPLSGSKKLSDGSNLLAKASDLYRGFPVVLAASLPPGGSFFLVKKGSMEMIGSAAPLAASGDPLALTLSFLASAVPIGLGVMVYWLFRTPAEVIKTQVQTGQSSSVLEALAGAREQPAGFAGLWKYYPVMLTLDIPFQIINFILYGFVSDAVANAGFDQSVWTRLFCGISCGMISAAITCPVDVCKTRIIRRDKLNQAMMAAAAAEGTTVGAAFDDNKSVLVELQKIAREEGPGALLLGLQQRLLYTGLANGIRLSAYGTSRMDLMMRSLDDM